MKDLEQIIEAAFENRAQGFEDRPRIEAAVQEAIGLLDHEATSAGIGGGHLHGERHRPEDAALALEAVEPRSHPDPCRTFVRHVRSIRLLPHRDAVRCTDCTVRADSWRGR